MSSCHSSQNSAAFFRASITAFRFAEVSGTPTRSMASGPRVSTSNSEVDAPAVAPSMLAMVASQKASSSGV